MHGDCHPILSFITGLSIMSRDDSSRSPLDVPLGSEQCQYWASPKALELLQPPNTLRLFALLHLYGLDLRVSCRKEIFALKTE